MDSQAWKMRIPSDRVEVMSFSKKPILIVAGMHRSGTSFAASLLQSAGVDLGSRLIDASPGNPKGHFEDVECVQFHESVLHSQGIAREGWTLRDRIPVRETFRVRAEAIAARKRQSSQPLAGWKDPRTTLFLDFWQAQIPEAVFWAIYRAPWEVVDSLFRRGDEAFQSNPTLAVDVWQHYNRLICDFAERHRDRVRLCNLESLRADPAGEIAAIAQVCGVELAPPADLYERALLDRQVSTSHRPAGLREFFPEALDLYTELEQRRGISEVRWPQMPPSYRDWAVQDWLEIRRAEREQNQLSSQLERLQADCQQARAECAVLESKWQQVQAERDRQLAELSAHYQQAEAARQHVESQWQQARSALARVESQQQQARDALARLEFQQQQARDALAREQSQRQQAEEQLLACRDREQSKVAAIERLQAELTDARQRILAMESSKFWKLRQAWMRVKTYLRLSPPESSARSPESSN